MLKFIRNAAEQLGARYSGAIEDPVERRRAERFHTAVPARVVMGGREHDAVVENLSVTGMTLRFERTPPLFTGALLEVRPDSFPAVSGTVRWVKDGRCGVSLSRVLADAIVEEAASAYANRKRPDANGSRISLPAIVRAPGLLRKVVIEDIRAGTLIFDAGMVLDRGLGIMIDIERMMPIGGHIRWNTAGRCGMMFTKLLSVPIAEEVTRRCGIKPAWLHELRAAHAEADRAVEPYQIS